MISGLSKWHYSYKSYMNDVANDIGWCQNGMSYLSKGYYCLIYDMYDPSKYHTKYPVWYGPFDTKKQATLALLRWQKQHFRDKFTIGVAQ